MHALKIPIIAIVIAALVRSSTADESAYRPQIAPASNEAALSMRTIKLPPGVRIHLAAAEPQLANPVAFCFDRSGRIYVAETFRQDNLRGVEDNRAHMDWLDDDLAAKTVDDRLAYLKKHLGDDVSQLTIQHDRIRQLRDNNGDGKYETATIFADGFNDVLDGTGAGLLPVRGDIWYTCIPNLWQLTDKDDDGIADQRNVLYRGFGVRYAFRGHDLHGLIRGPDGRIYFSVGDRGYHVVTPDGVLADPESGAVFRCEIDGSNLEVFATGLRNPQELAFNKYGDLFTGDNNSDSGDQARWVHVVQGSDSGWRMAYQYLPDRGPFNREKIWHPYHDGQPAYIVPPIANVGDGPSGLAYYPGTGMRDDLQDTFLMCDFRGTPAMSGIRTIKQKQRGATYELLSADEYIWKVLATDCEFGPDGSLYILDWVSGWTGVGKGRIYTVHSTEPATAQHEAAVDLLTSDLSQSSSDVLADLLAHDNFRVRLNAQYALAEKDAVDVLRNVVFNGTHPLAQLHGIWGLGQIARRSGRSQAGDIAVDFLDLFNQENVDLRRAAATAIGDVGELGAVHRAALTVALTRFLERESNARVQAALANSLARCPSDGSLPPLLKLLQRNNDSDPVLRHAIVMGLAGSQSSAALVEAAKNASSAQRLGIALALRRQKSPLIAQFLTDNTASVAEAAARAIYDVPIPDALDELAASLDGNYVNSQPFLRRALAANYRIGGEDAARRIARVAGNRRVRLEIRTEALEMLRKWANPSARDWILGMWRPIANRNADAAASVLQAGLTNIGADRPDVFAKTAIVAGELGVKHDDLPDYLLNIVATDQRTDAIRQQALAALGKLDLLLQLQGVQIALRQNSVALKSDAITLLPLLSPQDAFASLKLTLEESTDARLKQAALAGLATLNDPRVDTLLLGWLEQRERGDVPAAIHLDLLNAAAKRKHALLATKLQQIEQQLAQRDPLDALAMTLEGGNAQRGQDIFFNKAAVSCSRCHQLEEETPRVGPSLADVGKRLERNELLESIVAPSKSFAKGFETTILVTDDGKTHTGIVLEETDDFIRLVDDQGEQTTIDKNSVEDRFQGKSAMPDDVVKHLTLDELRDLIEFLAGLKGS